MFLINGNPLPLDTPFIDADGTQYPANWLRLASAEDKAAIGITEQPDPVRADDRFYWNGDINMPKALEDVPATDVEGNAVLDVDGQQVITKGLKSQFVSQTKQTAGTLLAQTDWMVIRKVERNVDIPAKVVSYRADVVAEANLFEQQISAVTTVEELAALQFVWPVFK